MRASLKPQGFTLLIAGIAALGAALVIAPLLAYGPRLDGDSLIYITLADNLLAGLGYTDIRGHPHFNHAPGFSTLLAIAGLVSSSPLQAAGWVNAAVLGLAIFFGGRWLSQKVASRFLTAWACLAIAFTPAVARTAHYAWSEPSFILFTTLALFQVDKFLSAARRASLIWAAIFTALACMTRYIGIALIAFTLALLLFQGGVALQQKLKRMAAYALVAATPIGAWWISSLAIKPDITAWKLQTGDLAEGAQRAFELLAGWMPFAATQDLGGVAIALAGGLALTTLAAVGWAFVRLRQGGGGTNFVLVNGGFALFHTALMVVTTTFINLTPLDNRYLSPAYMPILFVAVWAMDRIRQRWWAWTAQELAGTWRRAKSLALTAAAAAVLCLGMASLIREVLSGTLAAVNAPADLYTLRYWRESAILASLPKQNFNGRIWSNARPGIDFFLDTPKNGLRSQWLPPSKRQLQRSIAEGDFIAYFPLSFVGLTEDYGLADLRGLPELEIVAEDRNGILFEVKDANRDDGDDLGTASHFTALGEPVIRSNFDLHLRGGELIFTKAPCVQADVQTRFFLHLFPADIDDPAFPKDRRQYGFDNLDFDFGRWGVMLDGACMVTRRLPQYDIARIATGQYVLGQGQRIWSADFIPDSP